jgi:hypothetical protein
MMSVIVGSGLETIAQGFFYEAELVKGRCKKSIFKADGLFGASAGQ